MEEELETKAKEEKAEEEDEDIYHSPKVLFRLAVWSNILAWVVAIIEIAVFGFTIYANIYLGRAQLAGVAPYQLVGFGLNSLSPLFIGFAWFIVLKAVSEVIYLLMDIYEKP